MTLNKKCPRVAAGRHYFIVPMLSAKLLQITVVKTGLAVFVEALDLEGVLPGVRG